MFFISLGLNVALVLVLLLRPGLAPAAVRGLFGRYIREPSRSIAQGPKPPAAVAAKPKLWSMLASDELHTLIARLRAAGFSAEVIRAIIRSEVDKHYDPLFQAIRENDPNTPAWKLPPLYYTNGDKRMITQEQLQRERGNLLRELFADPFLKSEDEIASQHRQYGDMASSKIASVQRVVDDYADLSATLRAEIGSVYMKADQDKLAMLDAGKHADLAAILSPDELADYEMRSSPLTSFIGYQIPEFDASASEFAAIYAAERAVGEKLPGNLGLNDYQARQSAQKELNDSLRATLGDSRYDDLVRSSDNDYKALTQIAAAAGLPSDTALQAYKVRSDTLAESNRIYDDASLTTEQKRAALSALADTARVQLAATLGPVATPTYMETAQSWISILQNGGAVRAGTDAPLAVVVGGRLVSFGGGSNSRQLPIPAKAR